MAAVGGSARRYLPLVREKAAGQGANHRVEAVVLLRPGQSRAVAAPQAEEGTTPGFHHSVWHSLAALGGDARRRHQPPEGQAAGLQLPATLASRAQAPKEPKPSSRRCGAAGPPPQSAPHGQTTAPGSQRRALHFRERRRVPGLLRRLRALSGPGSAAGAARSAAERSLLGPEEEEEEGSEAEEVPGRWAPCSTCGKCGSWWTRREYGGPGGGRLKGGGGLGCGPSAGPALPPAASQHGRGAAPAEVAPSRPPPARLSPCPRPWVAARCLHPPPGPALAPLSQAGAAPPAARGLPAVPGSLQGPVDSLRVVLLLGVLPSLPGGLWGLGSP